MRETLRTETVRRSNTYSVPWFFQMFWGNKRAVGSSLDISSFKPIEILWFFFPFLVLTVQKHVV